SVLQLRDLRDLSAETIEKIADRSNAEFGRLSPKPPVFSFSSVEKKIYAHFGKQHRKNSEEEKNNPGVSYFENNLSLMVRSIYFRRMKEFDTAGPEKRKNILTETADDLKYWQEVYFNFVDAAGIPKPSLSELLREYDEMIEGFKDGAAEDEIRQITAFKKNLNLVLIGKEMQNFKLKLPFSVGF
ncbi:MAG: hypothetical protein FWE67_04685, partial [Planctomycetaceae bacterium]|nr:hypothetical protein [Planctomycetaceae bacterium]